MSSHTATISWADDGEFVSGRYSRAHQIAFDGGASLRGSSSPDVVPLPMSDPAGVDPEEMLIASVSACHMLWFLSLAQAAGIHVLSYRDRAQGKMGRVGPGRIAITEIVLRPEIVFAAAGPDQTRLDQLHHEAHERCFIANTLRAEISVEPPLAEAV